MSDHTPGPWVASIDGSYYTIDRQDKVGDLDYLSAPIAIVYTRADAVLVEQAPNLQMALRMLLDHVTVLNPDGSQRPVPDDLIALAADILTKSEA